MIAGKISKLRLVLSNPSATTTSLYWFHKAGYSIADQIAVSGANFALNILLAKWTSATDYGAFSVAFSIFLVIAGIHSALILEPMGIITHKFFSNQLTEYRFVILVMHFVFSFILSGIALIPTFLFLASDSPLAPHFYALCISMPWIFLFYLLKQSCYIEAKTYTAFKGSAVYATTILSLLFVLKEMRSLRSQDAFYIIAVANFCASIAIYNHMGITIRKKLQAFSWSQVIPILKIHWEYGRWILVASVFHSAGNAIYLPAVGWILGYGEAGLLRSVQIFLQPVQQTLFAISSLLVPWLAGQRRDKGSNFPLKMGNKIALAFLAFGFSYFILFITFGRQFIDFTYPNYQHSGINTLLYFVGITGVITAVAQAFGIILRAMGDSNAILLAKLASLICTITLGIALVFISHLYGAGIGMMLSISAEVAAMALYIKIKYKKEPQSHEQHSN